MPNDGPPVAPPPSASDRSYPSGSEARTQMHVVDATCVEGRDQPRLVGRGERSPRPLGTSLAHGLKRQ